MAERIASGLRAARQQAGLSRTALATLAGTTRQTVAALEAGAYPPTMPVALRLARALGRDVGTLFWLEPPREIDAEYLDRVDNARVTIGRVGPRVIALATDHAAQTDGIARATGPDKTHVTVRLFDDPRIADQTAIVAGCDPALPALGAHVSRHHAPLRIVSRALGSTAALRTLRRGEAHAAGLHLRDAAAGEWNLPFVRAALPGRDVLVVTVAHWSLGLLVAPGNPRGIHGAADLLREDITIVNREEGSGGRAALDRALGGASETSRLPRGYQRVVGTHAAVAEIVAAGFADAGPGVRVAAQAHGLDFIPLEDERFDLVIPREFSDYPPIQALLDTLASSTYRAELAATPGYDLSATGATVWNGPLPAPHEGAATNDVA